MHWQTVTNLITTIILSVFYFLIGFLNLLEADPPMTNATTDSFHPFISMVYTFVALFISWGIFLYFRKRPSQTSFVVTVCAGVFLIFIGIFLWKIG